MQINGGLHALVAQELLNGPDVVAAPEQVGGEGVAEGVAGDALPDPRPAAGVAHGALDGGGEGVPAPTVPRRAGDGGETGRDRGEPWRTMTRPDGRLNGRMRPSCRGDYCCVTGAERLCSSNHFLR